MAAAETGNSSASSSMTSTSHTMTAPSDAASMPKPTSMSGAPVDGDRNTAHDENATSLLEALEPTKRHRFITPTKELYEVTLDEIKTTLDGVAAEVADEQAERLKLGRQGTKRKRGERRDTEEVLRIRQVHTSGFAVQQVWEQARRVINAVREEVERSLVGLDADVVEEDAETSHDKEVLNGVQFGEDGFEIDSGDESLEEESGEEEAGEDDDGVEEEDLDELLDGAEMIDHDATKDELEDVDEGKDDEADPEDDVCLSENEEETTRDTFVPDPHGLNDGFFSIDDFNKQTEFLEQQDAAADPYTGEASDEEDIDWEADPMTTNVVPVTSRRTKAIDVDEESADDDDGPTFGNANLNAPEGDSEDEEADFDVDIDMDEAGDNTNEILYKDFFEPPPRKIGKSERQTKYLERQARKPNQQPGGEEHEMERAMADVRRDLLDDMSDVEDSADALSDVDPADPKSRKSAHERRQAKLAEEIRKLEAASVAKREWTLSGEARAVDRPLNSLLEEDLDFERTGKPVPVITAAVSESIEELIKRRILAQEFDEVIRRRPDSESVPGNARRGQFELDDTKPQQSLAEIYEEEHVKNANPDTYVSKADEKVKKQEQEIEMLWKEVCAKLDSLSSWHYKPKPPVPSLTVIGDVATITMEDAQPTTAAGVAGSESMLAPQEIYRAGKDREAVEKGEVVPKSGAPVAKQEMTREEKLRRRRREKERMRKGDGPKVPRSKKAIEKTEIVGDLKKGGVKIIGKKGDLRDVDGNKIKENATLNGGGAFKL